MKGCTRSLRIPAASALLTLFALFQWSGIYRHDRPLEGYLKLAEDPLLASGVKLLELRNGSWTSSGSAVLIDSLHALTAAHCLVISDNKDTVINKNGKEIRTFVSRGIRPGSATSFRLLCGNQLMDVESVLLYPDYLTDRSCDLAIMKLKSPVRGIVFPQINSSFEELHDTVTGLGYGMAGPANRPDLQLHHLRLAGMNILDSLGGKKVGGKESLLYADFDHLLPELKCNKLGDARPLDLEYCVAGGDSGGPLYLIRQQKVILYGITARGEVKVDDLMSHGFYCSLSGWTRVSVFEKWIRQNL